MDNERTKASITALSIFSISMLFLSFFSNPYASIVDIVFRAIVIGIIAIFIVSIPFVLFVWKGNHTNKGEQSDDQENSPIIDTTSHNIAIYNSADDKGNPSFDVYGIDADGEGYYLFAITQDDFVPYIGNPPVQHTEIKSIENVTLYVLTTGEFELHVGPNEVGTVRVIIFDRLPAIYLYSYDFNVSDILDPEE